jgi:ornithine carbamoyltransferase
MGFTMRGRHLLSLRHHSPDEIRHLVTLAGELKRAKEAGTEQRVLVGRNIALIFEKTSTRTRCAFEVAAFDQGAHVTFLDPGSSQIGHKETIKDTARVLGGMYDAIEYRGSSQALVEELAAHGGVPVLNGLTDEFHPTQMLADVQTMTEHSTKPWEQISFAFVGDGRNNVANSLLLVGAKLGMDVRIGAPRSLWPAEEHVKLCESIAADTGARLTVTDDPQRAVDGVDFIHTDVWVSMGEPVERWGGRVAECLPYQVNAALLAASGNPDVRFLHCLPAFHNTDTTVGHQVVAQFPELAGGIEVTEEVFESSANLAFEQAANRMHTIKAALVASLA